MAYQKELWTTWESLEIEYRAVLDNLEDFLDDESERWPSVRENLQFKVIPEIIDDLIHDSANEGHYLELTFVGESIANNEIGVAILTFVDEIDGVELRHLDKSLDGKITLMILASSNILARLESINERDDLISKFKQVLLEASDEQRSLMFEKRFVPYSN